MLGVSLCNGYSGRSAWSSSPPFGLMMILSTSVVTVMGADAVSVGGSVGASLMTVPMPAAIVGAPLLEFGRVPGAGGWLGAVFGTGVEVEVGKSGVAGRWRRCSARRLRDGVLQRRHGTLIRRCRFGGGARRGRVVGDPGFIVEKQDEGECAPEKNADIRHGSVSQREPRRAHRARGGEDRGHPPLREPRSLRAPGHSHPA